MRTPDWQSDDGAIQLHKCDCLDLLPTIPAGAVDAVVTDPPYGIGAGNMQFGKWRTSQMERGDWDNTQPDLSPMLALEVPTIVWGGNYFPLPQSRCFLVWDKGAGFKGRDFAECEVAWCSMDGNARVLTRDPLASRDYIDKQHPTQKPVAVMEWCLGFVDGQTVLDPYMGSATTAIACIRTGRRFIGCEIEPRYFDIAVRRVKAELAQPRLFTAPAPKAEQAEMFGKESA